MNKQFEAIQIQQFETTFFKMIDNHRAIINGYKINGLDGYGYIKGLNSDGVDYFELSKSDLEQKSLCKVYFLNVIRLVEFVEKIKNT